MNIKLIVLGVVLFVLAGLGIYYLADRSSNDLTAKQDQNQQQVKDTKRTCVADECLKDESITYPVASLSADVQSVMASAIADEYAPPETPTKLL